MIKRIALVGAGSTGKTTVFELLKNAYPKYEFLSETTRTVKNYGYEINENGTDTTQLAISTRHLLNLTSPYNLILDRCYLDLHVITQTLPEVSEKTKRFVTDTWEYVKNEYTHFIYFPIEFQAVDDSVRSLNEEWRKEIDEKFQKELIGLRNVLRVSGSPMTRVKQIKEFIK